MTTTMVLVSVQISTIIALFPQSDLYVESQVALGGEEKSKIHHVLRLVLLPPSADFSLHPLQLGVHEEQLLSQFL